MVRCWIHGSIGNCNPKLVRLICQGDMVSLNPCGVSPCGGGDRAPPLRGDGCSPDEGPPGRRRDAQGRAASVAWAQTMMHVSPSASKRSSFREGAAHVPLSYSSSWFRRGRHSAAAAHCCVLAISVCVPALSTPLLTSTDFAHSFRRCRSRCRHRSSSEISMTPGGSRGSW